MTEKLYYEDAYLRRFTGRVLSCAAAGKRWEAALDRTAFYPEGGGQPGDTGTLGAVRVLDTRERDGTVLHLCDGPLSPGTEVTGEVDWDRRFDHMQQHSGEHIVSGLICTRYGCDNVGFHLGAETVVIDFNFPIPPADLPEIELAANRVIWENRPFLVTHPGPAALERLDYRSKKELTGDVRIVECPGADVCACCGTHVAAAGALGLIKLRAMKPFREGVRIEMVSGRRAYDYVCLAAAQNHAVSVLTSAKPGGTAAAVERLQAELAQARYRLVGLENAAFSALAEQYADRGDVLLLREETLSPDALRRCCDAVAKRCRGRCAVFSPAPEGGWRYAVAHPGGDVRGFVKELNAALRGRGGGKPELAQGSVAASQTEIAHFFRA